MQQRNAKTSELFPINFSQQVASTTLVEIDGKPAVQLRYGVKKRVEIKTADSHIKSNESEFHSELSAFQTNLKILPNGFYYYHPHETHGVLIGNVCMTTGMKSNVNPFFIDPFIDTTRIACLHQTDSIAVLVGVDDKTNKLYTYTLLFPNEFQSQFKLITENKHDRSTIGTCFYAPIKNYKPSIVDISAAQNSLAVSFNNGDIRLFEFYDDKIDSYNIAEACDDFKDARLFHTKTHLVAYSPSNHQIRIWDPTKQVAMNGLFTQFTCPALKSLTISLDGAYLIGIAKEANIINFKVYCFEISNCEQHEIQLSEQIEDIAIHNNGHVYVLRPSKHSSSTLLLDTTHDVVNLGPIATILKNKDSLIKVEDYVEVETLALANKQGFSSRARSFFTKAKDKNQPEKNSAGALLKK